MTNINLKNIDIHYFIEYIIKKEQKKNCELCGHLDCFSIDKTKNTFKCFSCAKTGSIIDFYMHYKNIRSTNFAILQLNVISKEQLFVEKKLNFEKILIVESGIQKFADSDTQKIYEFIFQYLHQNQNQSFGKKYVENRGFGEDVYNSYFAYINNTDKLKSALKYNFETEILEKSGLFTTKFELIFRFHKLLMFYRFNNKIYYIQGRNINEFSTHKYQFLKSVKQICFNIDILKKIEPNSDLVVCEGVIDCLTNQYLLNRNAISINSITSYAKLTSELFLKTCRIKNLTIIVSLDNELHNLNTQNSIKSIEKILTENDIKFRSDTILENTIYKDVNDLVLKKDYKDKYDFLKFIDM
jgi:hypothetical protein